MASCTMSPELLLSPWALALLGLLVGSFLNVVIHRLPAMQERRWWADVAAQLGDAASHKRVFGKALPASASAVSDALGGELGELPRLGLARPRSRCPKCGAAIRWYENVPLLSWVAMRAR